MWWNAEVRFVGVHDGGGEVLLGTFRESDFVEAAIALVRREHPDAERHLKDRFGSGPPGDEFAARTLLGFLKAMAAENQNADDTATVAAMLRSVRAGA